MKYELDLVKPTVTADTKAATTASRRAVREATDAVIHDALLLNDLPGLVQQTCQTMLVVASVLAAYEQDPQVSDFVEAAQASIENGRAVMDKGLMLHSWETVNCGAVMLELTVRGICAALSVPYEQVLTECHRAGLSGESPQIRRILTEAGVIKEPAAAASDEPVRHHLV